MALPGELLIQPDELEKVGELAEGAQGSVVLHKWQHVLVAVKTAKQDSTMAGISSLKRLSTMSRMEPTRAISTTQLGIKVSLVLAYACDQVQHTVCCTSCDRLCG